MPSESVIRPPCTQLLASYQFVRPFGPVPAVTTLVEMLPERPMALMVAKKFVVATVVATLAQTFSDERSDARIVVGGTSNLARFGADFDTTVGPVLEALEEQVVLLKLLGEASGGVTVRIGGETGLDTLAGTAVVASAYGGDGSRATLGTVGPTRMDYPGTIATVAAVARYVGRMLDDA